MLRRDLEATAKAGFADKRSYISFDGHRYLFGKEDIGRARWSTYVLSGSQCYFCHDYAGWWFGELHHLKGGLGRQRCWCDHNLVWACGPCHRKQHVQVGGRKP